MAEQVTAPRLDLGELRRLHEAATPDWEIDPTGDIGTHFIGTADEAVAYFEPIGETVEVDDEFENPQSVANAACAVAARNALPALLSIAEAAEAWRNVPKEPLHMDEIVKRAAALCAAVDAALAAVRKEEKGD